MKQFGLRQFSQIDPAVVLPDPSDVAAGVSFGPDGSLVGTLVVNVTPITELDGFNLSLFDQSEMCALDSWYFSNAVAADYTSVDTGLTSRVLIDLVDQSLQAKVENGQRITLEHLVIRIRRYAGVELPMIDDQLSLSSSAGLRKYRLSVNPVSAESQLEWKLEFSRTVKKSAGGTDVISWNG